MIMHWVFQVLVLAQVAFSENTYYVSSNKILHLFENDYHLTQKVFQILEHSQPFKEILNFANLWDQVTSPFMAPPWTDEIKVFHPLNQFMLIFKFARTWDKFKRLILALTKNETSEVFWEETLYKDSLVHRHSSSIVPVINDLEILETSEEDLSRAAFGILRLQEVYHLKTRDLRNGLIRGVSAVRPLSEDEENVILGAAVKFRDKCRGSLWIKEFSESVAERLGVGLETQMTQEDQQYCLSTTCLQGKNCSKPKNKDSESFIRLCNGRAALPSKHHKLEGKRLHHCSLYAPRPVFYWAPMRAEWLFERPTVVVFVGFAEESELKTMWNHAPKEARSRVVGNNNTGEVSEVRVGVQSWLSDRKSREAKKISDRIGRLTGLSMETVDDWQLGSYGIGGQYTMHHDYFDMKFAKNQWFYKQGFYNRFATFMIYLSDVEMGGYTVFPRLNIAVKPVLGNAIFWHNLRSDSNPYIETYHGGCPVLMGNKKIANKWVYYGGQFQSAPCREEDRLIKNDTSSQAELHAEKKHKEIKIKNETNV